MKQSLWQGPEVSGVTQSLLQKFYQCRDRFWLKVVCGLAPKQSWSDVQKMEYGSLFHEGMEAAADDRSPQEAIDEYAEGLKSKYQSSREDIDYWTTICKRQFPLYEKHWAGKDKNRTYILQEETFEIPYTLPSGKNITLRGKFDAAYLPSAGSKSIYLQENKTKGKVDKDGIVCQLHEDLQTGFYLVALTEWAKTHYPEHQVEGVLYNVIRRPLGDNRAPKRRKSESSSSFIDRVFSTYTTKSANSFYPIEKHPDDWYFRWPVTFTAADLNKFRRENLNPILEQLWMWWDSIQQDPLNPWEYIAVEQAGLSSPRRITKSNPHHWRRPFGIYDSMGLGYQGDYHEYVTTGSKIGLEQINDLYPELD